jgi:hypothetical protein
MPAQIEHIVQFVSKDDISSVLSSLFKGSSDMTPSLIRFPFIPYFKLRYGVWNLAHLNYTQLMPFNAILLVLPCCEKGKKS